MEKLVREDASADAQALQEMEEARAQKMKAEESGKTKKRQRAGDALTEEEKKLRRKESQRKYYLEKKAKQANTDGPKGSHGTQVPHGATPTLPPREKEGPSDPPAAPSSVPYDLPLCEVSDCDSRSSQSKP